jgi:two-component system NarL family response regulator
MVVGGSPVLRAGLASLLGGYEDMSVVAVEDTADQCRGVDTDIAVVALAGLDADAASRTLAGLRTRPDIKLVVLTDRVDDVVRRALATRVGACLNLGTADTHELANAVRAVTGGRTIISSEFVPALCGQDHAMAPWATLTPRERDVLALLAEGQSNKSIARQLDLRVGTIRIYVSGILAKLGVTNRTEAAAAALRNGA